MSALSPGTWLARPRPNPSARLRLVCFPPAGGNEVLFRPWPRALPADLEAYLAG